VILLIFETLKTSRTGNGRESGDGADEVRMGRQAKGSG